MTIQTFFGFIAFITSVIGLLPQIIKSLQTRSTHDLSMMMLINYAVCSIAWVVYGRYTESVFVLASNVFGLLSAILLIMIKLNFDQRQVNDVAHS